MRIKAFLRRSICQHRSGPAVRRCSSIAITLIPCVATVTKAGKYDQVRLYFLEWFETYLKTQRKVDPRVTASLRRALRSYRNPRVHYMLSVPNKVLNRCRRASARAGRLIWRQVP